MKKLYFDDTIIVKGLANKLKKEVRSWGDEMLHADAIYTVARCFGYDDLRDLQRMVGLADPSLPDRHLDAQEQTQRFAQYVGVLVDIDFSREEAVDIVSSVGLNGWWGFGVSMVERPCGPDVTPAPKRVEFRDIQAVTAFHRSLRREIRQMNIDLPFGCRKLMAKLFGFDTFKELIDVAGHGVPTPSDWYVSPGELDDRVRGYMGVLRDVGLGDAQAVQLLRDVDAEYWWGLEHDEWEQTPRQATHADRVEGSGRPTWRPRRVRQS